MQADFCGIQPPFSKSVIVGLLARPESAASGPGTGGTRSQSADNNGFFSIIARLLGEPLSGDSFARGAGTTVSSPGDTAVTDLGGPESAASGPGIGGTGSQSANNSGFLGIIARLLGELPQTGSLAPGAETAGSFPGDTAVADLSDQDTLLLQTVMEIGLDPEYLKNLVAVGESPTGPEPWQSLQTLLETFSFELQQSEEPMPFRRLQALSTILKRVAELVSAKLETSDPRSSAPACATGAAELPASSESVPAGFVRQLNELLAAVRSASGPSAGSEQAAAVMTETARSDGIGPENFAQSSDTPDPKPADIVSRVETPGNTFLQQRVIWTHEKPRLQTQAERLGTNPAAPAASEAEGHTVWTRTPDKQVDDSATRGSKQPLSPVTAAVDPSSTAGLNGAQKTPLMVDPVSAQERPGVGDTQPPIEETKIKLVDLREPEGIGWSQSSGDRSAESAPASRVDPQAREALQSQALQQIIQKASVHLRNGQSEVKIELKPEFLGHIRMQIVTENHQVTLRILTEFAYVKDLIEHNIQHLRAELQQHGLKMDALNVSVANDSQTPAGGQWHTTRSKAAFRAGRAASGERQPAGEGTAATPVVGRRSGNSAIDYFI